MFLLTIGVNPELFIIAAFLDLILLIIVLVVFFGMGRNLKRIRQIQEKVNKVKFVNYAYLAKNKNEFPDQKEEIPYYGEGFISEEDIIGELDDGTPLIKDPKN